MKYESIIFDFGGTLGYLDKAKFLEVPPQLHGLIASLYHRGYRLGVISNSNQHSDSHWVRNRLQQYKILAYFDAVLCVYKEDEVKPCPDTFRRMLTFLGAEPAKALMVGDSVRCDGGCRNIGMDYLEVRLDEGLWIDALEQKLCTKPSSS